MIKKVHVRCSTIQFDDSNLRTQLLQLPGPWSMESRPASRLKELDCSKVRAHTHALRQKLAQFNVRRRAGISSVRSPALFRKRARFKRAVLVALGSCMFGNLARWYENPRCHAPRAAQSKRAHPGKKSVSRQVPPSKLVSFSRVPCASNTKKRLHQRGR